MKKKIFLKKKGGGGARNFVYSRSELVACNIYLVIDERTSSDTTIGLRKQSCGRGRLHGWIQLPETILIESVGIGVQKTELPRRFTIPFEEIYQIQIRKTFLLLSMTRYTSVKI